MGKSGPLGKHTKLRLIENDNRNRLQPEAPAPTEKKKPVMPPGLDARAQREWRRVAPLLFELNLLTKLDTINLAIYCQLISNLERYEKILSESGETYMTPSGFIKPRPEYNMKENTLKEIRQFTKFFGLSPDARQRMNTADPGNERELSEFESLLD